MELQMSETSDCHLLCVGLLCSCNRPPPPNRSRSSTRAAPINLIIGGGAGGGYDVYYRALARHWASTFPAIRRFIPKNQPAASGLAAAAALYTTVEQGRLAPSARSPTTSRWTRCSAIRARATTRSSSTGSARSASCRTSARPGTRARSRPSRRRSEREVVVAAAGARRPTPRSCRTCSTRCSGPSSEPIIGYDPGAGLTMAIERRRGRRHLRAVVVDHEGVAPALDQGQAAQRDRADGAREAARPAGRAGRARSREATR